MQYTTNSVENYNSTKQYSIGSNNVILKNYMNTSVESNEDENDKFNEESLVSNMQKILYWIGIITIITIAITGITMGIISSYSISVALDKIKVLLSNWLTTV